MSKPRKKPKWREVRNPKADRCYWVVIDIEKGLCHFFNTEKEAFEYSSFHNIPDCDVYFENHD